MSLLLRLHPFSLCISERFLKYLLRLCLQNKLRDTSMVGECNFEVGENYLSNDP